MSKQPDRNHQLGHQWWIKEKPVLDPIPLADPEVARRVENTIGKGWKLHLNFDPDNQKDVRKVDEFLTGLKGNGSITAYKLGNGGGKHAGAPGKEATVYVGSLDDTITVANSVEGGLGGILIPQEGDVLNDDVPLSPNSLVWGRFEATVADDNLHQYGSDGVPFLNNDMSSVLFGGWGENKPVPGELRDRARQYATATYGEFFNGTQTHFDDLVTRKQQYLAAQLQAT